MTGAPPAVGVTVNVLLVKVDWSIASLNVTVIALVTGTPVASAAGSVATTLGGASSRVVKENVKSDCRLLPGTSFTPVVMVAESAAPFGSAEVGVSCAVRVAAL